MNIFIDDAYHNFFGGLKFWLIGFGRNCGCGLGCLFQRVVTGKEWFGLTMAMQHSPEVHPRDTKRFSIGTDAFDPFAENSLFARCAVGYRHGNKESRQKFPSQQNSSMRNNAEPNTFGQRLRWLREKHGLTLDEFGKAIKVGRSYLSKLENGKSQKTSEHFLFKVCDVFGLEWNWLLKGEGKPFLLDERNEAANAGQLPPPYVAKLSNEQAVFFDACFAAGIAFGIDPSPEGIAKTLLNLIEGKSYTEQLRLEVARVLLTELVAQLSAQNAGDITPGIKSDLGKMAMASVGAVKQQIQSEKAEIDLTCGSLKGKTDDVKSELEKLVARVKRLANKPGAKSALAKFLKVAPARITEWLHEDPEVRKEPGGDYTLRLLQWVEQQERQK